MSVIVERAPGLGDDPLKLEGTSLLVSVPLALSGQRIRACPSRSARCARMSDGMISMLAASPAHITAPKWSSSPPLRSRPPCSDTLKTGSRSVPLCERTRLGAAVSLSRRWAAAFHAAPFTGVRYGAQFTPGDSGVAIAVFGDAGGHDYENDPRPRRNHRGRRRGLTHLGPPPAQSATATRTPHTARVHGTPRRLTWPRVTAGSRARGA